MQREHISTFLKVVECDCNFTSAAKALHTSQPSVTRLMKALQATIGRDVPLFETRGRRKTLTGYGEKLCELLGPLKESLDEIPKRLRDEADSGVRDPVTVAAGMTAARYLLPKEILKFKRRNKGVGVSVRVELWADTLKGLRSGDLDFALRSSATIPHDMVFWVTESFEHKLIAPRRHPITKIQRVTLRDMSRHSFVAPGVDTRGWHAIRDFFAHQGLDCRLEMTVGGWDLVKHYVRMGLGLAVVPSFCIRPEDRKHLAVYPAPKDYPLGNYGIIYQKGRYFSRSALELISMLAPGFKKGITRIHT
ncbi:LysR family transcriptional regulator [Elusimicrobiota bacterium]